MSGFDTSAIFSGGAGMLIEYHDVIKPAWLYAVFKLIYDGYRGLPLNIIRNMPLSCILEWYLNRRYRNPLKQLDWKNEIPEEQLNELMSRILTDTTVYTESPTLYMIRMFIDVYRRQSMIFPIYVYSEQPEAGIDIDCQNLFRGIRFKYFHGELTEALRKTSENCTYIFSDVSKVKIAAETLIGSCSHVLLASDYRYNYIGNRKEFKIDLMDVMRTHPFVRIGTTNVFDVTRMSDSFKNVTGEERNATN